MGEGERGTVCWSKVEERVEWGEKGVGQVRACEGDVVKEM